MRSQKCSQCGTLLDISKLEKGSKFACANCGTILVVGEGVAVKRSLSESGPAFKPKTAGKEAVATTPSRRRRAPAEPAGRDAPRKSPAPLFIGLGVVAVIAIVIGVVMSQGGGDGGGGTPPVKQATAEDWWAEVSPGIDGARPRDLREMLSEAKSRKYDKDLGFWAPKAAVLYKALLAAAPEDREANQYVGNRSLRDYPGLASLWEQMEEKRKLLTEEQRAFVERYEERYTGKTAIWLDRDTYAAEKALLDAFAEWLEELKKDPSAEFIQKGRDRARQEMKGHDAGGAAALPFILLFGFKAEEGANLDARRSEHDAKAQRYSSVLRVVGKEFETRFREPLQLPKANPKTALYSWVFQDLPSYEEFARDNPGFAVNPEVRAYFRLRSRWVYAGLSDDASISRYLGQDLGIASATQLMWLYSRDPKKKWGEHYFEEWNGLWFTVGFAAWLGGGIRHDASTGNATWTGFDRRWVAHLQVMRDNAVPLVPLRELVQLLSWEGFLRWRRDTWHPMLQADEDLPETVLAVVNGDPLFSIKMLFAQSWYLAHFMNEYESGKYREKYRDLLMTALRGKRKPEAYAAAGKPRWRYSYEAFQEIMGLKSDADWTRLQKEHDSYLPGTLRDAK